MRSNTTLNMKCLWARWFGLRMSAKHLRLKIGKALAAAKIASYLSLAILAQNHAVIVT
jgi:hypothetical protein